MRTTGTVVRQKLLLGGFVLALASLSCAGASAAVGFLITSDGVVWNVPQQTFRLDPFGSLETQGIAVAKVFTEDAQQGSSLKTSPGGTTPVAMSTGSNPHGTTDVEAQATWTQTRFGNLFTLTSTGYGVVNQTPPRVSPRGIAAVTVRDPLLYTRDASGSATLVGDFFLSTDLVLQAAAPGVTAETSAWAGTSLSGFEFLFDFSLLVKGDEPGSPTIEFTSNPLLGLDDGAIRAGLAAALIFDPLSASYTLGAQTSYATFAIPIPEDVDSVSVSFEFAGEVQVPSIPLPAGGFLLMSGLALPVLAFGRRRAK